MSMEDILKVLVNSRQQGSSSAQGSDPMTDLIGGLLSGAQGQSHAPVAPAGYQQQQQQTQSGGLGDMMGLLEMFMGGNQSGATQSAAASDPIMMLIQPYVGKLAKKANIPPEIAMIVVSFVAHKLLSHHPTSGRDSNSFNLDDLIGQMSSGKVDKSIYETSGMVKEISKSTGLDETTASKNFGCRVRLIRQTDQKRCSTHYSKTPSYNWSKGIAFHWHEGRSQSQARIIFFRKQKAAHFTALLF